MAKSHSSFVCQQCGYKSPSYLGKCPNCNSWSSFVETIERDPSTSLRTSGAPGMAVNRRERQRETIAPRKLSDVSSAKVERVLTKIGEVDQVLGGGLVPGSLILLSGDPGIGKSTLTLQLISHIGGLYVSGEESAEQVKLRAQRLGLSTENIYILPETNVEAIIEAISVILRAQPEESRRKAELPTGSFGSESEPQDDKSFNLIIIDSIQTLWSEELTGAPGAVGQVRECTLKLLEVAKTNHIPIIIIGHVTKEGTIAGPKALEHIVDTVLYLEGERYQSLRLLRTTKNRFGPVDEVGVFSMVEEGMKEVKNPSEIFLNQESHLRNASDGQAGIKNQGAGQVTIATLEGSRPLLVEIQALTVSTQMPIPRRVGTGINGNRLQMLVAIIQKHLRLPLDRFDIFVNVASGIKVFEPAADLGICLAIISSFKSKPISDKTVAIGEVGLLGEIRNVIGLDRRIKEAKKLGFTEIISPKSANHLTKIIQVVFS